MSAASRTGVRPGLFAQQLHRAAAQRGRLDPVYQDLSDHWTQILQRLYPVWALLGPGLSDPGHIEIHSRTVYLDSDSLLGPREAIAAGALEQRAILRTFGVALHETLHAKHTKRWAIEHDIALSESQDPGDRQLAVDRRLLEEPRMEAHGVRDFPPDSLRGRFVRRALQAAVVDVILPAFAEQMIPSVAAGVAPSRDLAARSTVYLQARTHYGVLDPAVLKPMHAVWDRVLGAEDLSALDDLYASVIWSPDGDLHRLDAAARTYRGIVGEPEQAPSTAGRSGDPTGAPHDEGRAGGADVADGSERAGGSSPGSLADALEQAIATARETGLSNCNWYRPRTSLRRMMTTCFCRAGGRVKLVDSAFVQAMREGWVVMIDEVNTARDVALLSINATLDGRLSLYLAATGESVVAQPGFAVLLAYNPGLVGATDIPEAWHSRFPATLEVTSNWAALARLGAPTALVTEAMRLDRQRIAGEDGLGWTPQFRDVESLWRMSERVGERAALAFFASNLHEQVTAGKIQDAEAAAACRMLDQAGYGRLRVSASSGLPNLHGYPRAVT